MTTSMRGMATGVLIAAAMAAGAAGAQTTTPVIPENYSLPPGDQEPAPVVPVTPAPTPTPVIPAAPAPAPAPARPAPGTAPVVAPAPRATAMPRSEPSASPSATPTPEAAPTPAPSPVVEPARPRARPTRVPETVPVEPRPMGEGAGTAPTPDSSEGIGWWAGALIAALMLVGVALGAWLLMRRRAPREQGGLEVEPETVSVPPEIAAPAGGRLRIDFRPTRAGINMVTATVMGEVVIANTGDAPAERVLVDVRLISAHGGQDEEIRTIHAGPPGRPAAPAFSLGVGEERRLSIVAVMPNGAIRPIKAGAREMFAPLVVLTAAFEEGGTRRRAGRAFAVGIRRESAAKLAPIWLDGTARMHDQVAARAHGEGFAG